MMPSPELVQSINSAVMERKGKPERGEIRFCCPAHDDEHPSARWSQDKATWVCDVCKSGGGAVDLAKRLEIPLPPLNGKGHAPKQRVVASFDYGPYIIDRIEPGKYGRSKEFRPRRSDGNGGWINTVPQELRTLYRLRESLAMPGPVVITGGEAKADKVSEMGVSAVAYPFGEGSWTDHYRDLIPRDREVILLPDRDKAGQDAARKIAESFERDGRSVRVADLGRGNDVLDFLRDGGTEEDVKRAITEAKPWSYKDEPDKRKSQTVTELAEAVEAFRNEKPFKTGHATFDRLANGGFRRRQLFIVGASTGVGKTRTLLAIALGLARSGYVVLFASLELPSVFMASIIGQDPGKLYLVDTLRTVPEIALEVERIRQETGVQDLVVVLDYLQKLHNDAQNEERRIAINAEDCYELAKSLEVPVVCAAQLNRIGIRAGEEPDLTCLKGSGGIEQNGDVVVLMWRAEDSNILYLKTAKNRWGKIETAALKVDYVALNFEELSETAIFDEELQSAIETYVFEHGPTTRKELSQNLKIQGTHPKVFNICSVVAKSPLLEMDGLIVKPKQDTTGSEIDREREAIQSEGRNE